MSIFDIFSDRPAKDAAAAQTAGLNKGYDLASSGINSAIGSLNSNYTSALQPYLQNYSTANGGVDALKNLLGLNGQAGSDAAMKSLEATPGFQFQQKQGNASINAAEAASGNNFSGKQLIDLSNYNQGLAGTTYQNAVNNLMPFLSSSNSNAGGIANIYAGLGNSTAGQYDQLAQAGWNKETGIGNANANADLSAYNASGNFWNMLGSLGGMKTGNGGTVGGNALSNIGSGIGSLASSIFAFSDERLKEDIEPVGKLYDGQDVYKYRYIGDPRWQIGLMAQEVETIDPGAVKEFGGFKAVNYDRATSRAASLAHFLEAA